HEGTSRRRWPGGRRRNQSKRSQYHQSLVHVRPAATRVKTDANQSSKDEQFFGWKDKKLQRTGRRHYTKSWRDCGWQRTQVERDNPSEDDQTGSQNSPKSSNASMHTNAP